MGQNSGGVLKDGGDAAETNEEILVVDVEFRNPGSSVDVSASHTVTPLQRTLNLGDRSIHHPEVIVEDNMAPKEFITDVDVNGPREMWLGCEFPGREKFRSLAKFAIYTNFTLKHIIKNKSGDGNYTLQGSGLSMVQSCIYD